jgi:uracil-DNA glycosylase family 4
MPYPQKNSEQLAAYFRQLRRKGIRSVYFPAGYVAETAEVYETGAEGLDNNMPNTTKQKNSLDKLAKTVSGCIACPLHESRTQTVFGTGNPRTKVLFIGEAPGRDEDLKGEPFVGRAGQLLNKILAAIDLNREDVYITNILKCRPPNNRDPQESEVRECENYLKQQIKLINPTVICALGRVSAQWLLQTTAPLGTLRQGEYYYEGIRILPTYHPAALLRNPNFKKPAWEDFKQLKAMLDKA